MTVVTGTERNQRPLMGYVGENPTPLCAVAARETQFESKLQEVADKPKLRDKRTSSYSSNVSRP